MLLHRLLQFFSFPRPKIGDLTMYVGASFINGFVAHMLFKLVFVQTLEFEGTISIALGCVCAIFITSNLFEWNDFPSPQSWIVSIGCMGNGMALFKPWADQFNEDVLVSVAVLSFLITFPLFCRKQAIVHAKDKQLRD